MKKIKSLVVVPIISIKTQIINKASKFSNQLFLFSPYFVDLRKFLGHCFSRASFWSTPLPFTLRIAI